MSARISPPNEILQGLNPDGSPQDVKVSKAGSLNVENLSVEDLLYMILVELRKHTIHFESMTGLDDFDNEEEEVCE
jgi:hypothetical protein